MGTKILNLETWRRRVGTGLHILTYYNLLRGLVECRMALALPRVSN